MTKVRLLVILAVVALVLFPTLALAQQQPGMPCRIHGSVQIDGADVADGVVIVATIEDDTYDTVTPAQAGASTYFVEIQPEVGTSYTEGATITFTIDGEAAGMTAAWEEGGNIALDLSIGEGTGIVIGGGTTISDVMVNMVAADAAASVTLVDGVMTFNIPAQPGEKGDTGAAGAEGDEGPAGSGSSVIGIIAIVLAAIAIVMAVTTMRKKV